MKKNFVFDTNVLLYDPNALLSFEENNVIIPIYVIEEVDNFKKDLSELGRNARQVSRILDDLRKGGLLTDGVPIPSTNGGTLRVAFADEELPPKYALGSSADNRILATAVHVKKEDPDTPLEFISKDINLRIRAAALGLQVADYTLERTDISELYSGVYHMEISPDSIAELYQNGEINAVEDEESKLPPNSFAVLTGAGDRQLRHHSNCNIGADVSAAARKRPYGLGAFGRATKNSSSPFDLLLDDNIRLVTLVGQAGTGKTLLALAAGLQKAVEEQKYQRLLVSRPVFPPRQRHRILAGRSKRQAAPLDAAGARQPGVAPRHLLGRKRKRGGLQASSLTWIWCTSSRSPTFAAVPFQSSSFW